MAETGSKRRGISVDTKHLFPMIMQWPYAEKDIFLHKQVSNATDAVTKLPAMTADEANARWHSPQNGPANLYACHAGSAPVACRRMGKAALTTALISLYRCDRYPTDLSFPAER